MHRLVLAFAAHMPEDTFSHCCQERIQLRNLMTIKDKKLLSRAPSFTCRTLNEGLNIPTYSIKIIFCDKKCGFLHTGKYFKWLVQEDCLVIILGFLVLFLNKNMMWVQASTACFFFAQVITIQELPFNTPPSLLQPGRPNRFPCKQCRSRWDGSSRAVSSGYTLFTFCFWF